MAKDKDLSWIPHKMVHPNLSYWGLNRQASAAEQGVAHALESLQQLQRHRPRTGALPHFGDDHPQHRSVHHPRYSIARENYKKERETFTGRYTDILVKEGGRWLFISSAGGDDPKK